MNTDDKKADQELMPERQPSGIAGLDIILNGGFLKGAAYIVEGPPGAGKTIFGNQLCYAHTAAGGKALYVTLLAESHDRMLMHMRAFSFYDSSRVPKALTYVSAFRVLEDEGLKGLLNLLRREVQALGATVLILDGLVPIVTSAESDIEFKKFIHELQTAAILVGCTIFLLTSRSGDPAQRTVSPEETMVDGLISLEDHLKEGWRAERRLEIRKFRGSDYMRGVHAFRISEKGIEVFPRIESRYFQSAIGERESQRPRLPTGLASFDKMLRGGLPEGSTSLLIGPTGIGKTTFGLHFLGGCSKAEPGLLFGFYEPSQRLLGKADSFSMGLRSLVEDGAVEILWQPATEVVLDEIGEQILRSVRCRGVRRVFIDGLAGLEDATSEPTRIRRYCTALGNELRVLGVTSLYTAEADEVVGGLPGASSGGAVSLRGASAMAENVMLMRFVELRSGLHRIISILKLRDGDFDATLHEFAITDKGLVVDEAAERAERTLADLVTGPSKRMRASTRSGEE